MERKGTSRGKSRKNQISDGGGEQATTNSVALGDVIFIRLRGGSWWPAQVLDDNSVHESIKPSKRSAGEVLVRLYGSYTYLYADPIKCRSEFEMILKHNNGSYRKILQQALEQDLPSTKSCRSKRSASKSKDKKSNQNQTGGQQSAKLDGSQRKLRQRNSPLREAKKQTSEGNEKLENLEANSSKAEGKAGKRASDQNGKSGKNKLKINIINIEKKRSKSSRQDEQQIKAKSLSPGTEKKMKRNQDKTREIVKQRIPSAEKEAKRKSYRQDEEQKDLMLEKKRPRSKPTEEQNKVKRRKQNEILNDDDPSSQSPETTSLGKSQELSARRIRVMKSLGLIAPPGSPFHKDGHIHNLSS